MNKRAKEIVADLNKKFAPLIKQAESAEDFADEVVQTEAMNVAKQNEKNRIGSSVSGISFPYTPEAHPLPDNITPGENGEPVAIPEPKIDTPPPVDDSMMARIMAHLVANKEKYALGAGAAGVGALGAGLMMGGNEEDEEDEERQRV